MKATDIDEEKNNIRKKIAAAKQNYGTEQLMDMSCDVISTLELLNIFQSAKCVLAYYSMPDEVNTRQMIKRYCDSKQFILPIVDGNMLRLEPFSVENEMQMSKYGILEPLNKGATFDVSGIDLVLVPGVVFDRNLNRMGRGRGFYDRLLPTISAPKVAICFDFQLIEKIPTNTHDVKMDFVVTETEIIASSFNF